ncbi:hypothetical protein NEF87_000172 [Candidatus Lokiarchaeum ossiferum]|uniref:Uncharacterized protein n=1 Tax=Candidatus Lokiarchaeum ossiferum TaxID=2951803 RepID=A0ABY6HLW9_9ARCH|nr:hypothetical protein NEF87_000172 [Candidatus Lokiarchaeum sp. B-35]
MASEENRKSKYFLKQEAKRLKDEERRRKSLEKSEARLRKEMARDDKRNKKNRQKILSSEPSRNKPIDTKVNKKKKEKTNKSSSGFQNSQKRKSKKEQPKKEQPKKEKPKKDKPKKDKPKKEKPKKEKPKKEQPKKEKPKKEKAKKEISKKEKPKKEKPKKEKPKKEKPKKEKPKKEKPKKEKAPKSVKVNKPRKKKHAAKDQILKEITYEKTVQTEILSHRSNKKRKSLPSPLSNPQYQPKPQKIQSSRKPEPKISGFTFATELKNDKINFTDTIKAKFIIANNGYLQDTDRILYKIYMVNSSEEVFLLKIGLKSFKRNLKLSISTKFSKIIPPTPFFNFRIELFSHRKLIASYDGEEIKVDDIKAEKNIKIQSIDIVSNVIIPKNPLIFWLKYTYKPIPRARTVEMQVSLSSQNLNLEENTYELELGDSSHKGNDSQIIPFSFNIPEFTDEKEKLKFNVSIMDVESQKTLFSKNLLINGKSSLMGLRYEHIGYKRDIKIGETAYMVADLINKTPYKVKGKATFTFFTVLSESVKCFSRKFRIRPNNYDKISEDITLTEDLGGKKMWVIVRSKFKTKRGKILLEGMSKQINPRINNSPHFIAKIRAAIHADGVYFNDIITIGIDTRIRTRDKLKHAICEVVQNFENIDIKPIHTFKIKDLESFHSNFHWKVPPKYGQCTLDVRFYVNGLRVLDENIEKSPLTFDLYPKPK